ncbi:MAG: bifunctional diguanylate cyclase/phosphodiesterase [Epsilonproteobacteria bacterium]|nr:bifunctional diguanylate cyclase/phosphodiesterase [Campylobacterota bacterium]
MSMLSQDQRHLLFDTILQKIPDFPFMKCYASKASPKCALPVVLDHLGEAIFLTYQESPHFLYVNETAAKMLGYSRDEFTNGMSLFDIDPSWTPDIAKKFFVKMKEEKTIRFTTRHKTKNGHTIPIDMSISRFDFEGKSYHLAVCREIADQKSFVEQMLGKETCFKFKDVVDNSPNNIAWYDSQCRVVYLNYQIQKYFDVPIETLIGKEVSVDTFGETYAEYIEKLHSVIRTGKGMEYDQTFRFKDEEHVHHIQMVPELDKLGNVVGIIAIGRDVSMQKKAEKKVEFLAYHDHLTELPNRVRAKLEVDQFLLHKPKTEHSHQMAVLFIDVDDFQTVNDSFGHAIGDMLLKSVAQRLQDNLRDNDILARHSGDEFLIILNNIRSNEDITSVCERIVESFQTPLSVDTHHLTSSVSIGVAVYPIEGDDFDALVRKADIAMHKAKELGKNMFYFFDASMNEETIEYFRILHDMKNAIANREFILHYQPQIDIQSQTITGAEALLRWIHPTQGLIAPSKFIPIAENSGLIIKIGEWVINEACKQAVLWHRQGIQIVVAVNISTVQFKRGNLEEIVKKALASSGLSPEFFEIELTESAMMYDTEKIRTTIQNLKAIGVKLSIDDFGTGYSSLSYLKKFAVDKLKIDQSFIKNLLHDQEDAAIVKAVIQMAKSLNLKTIAEGVEEGETLIALGGHGCDEVQGFHFAKPMPQDEFRMFAESF